MNGIDVFLTKEELDALKTEMDPETFLYWDSTSLALFSAYRKFSEALIKLQQGE